MILSQKVSTSFAFTVVVILAAFFAVVIWHVSQQTVLEDNMSTFLPNQVISQVSDGIVYTNEKYGFSLTLPKSWEKEKTVTKEVSIPESMDNEQGISLGYALDVETKDLGKNLDLYNVYIISVADWEKIDHEVVWELGRNKTYVFGISPSNDLSATNQNGGQSICTDFAVQQKNFCAAYADLKSTLLSHENLRKLNFKILDEQTAYKSDRVGYTFSYPKTWKATVNQAYANVTHWSDNAVFEEVQVGDVSMPNVGGLNIENFQGSSLPSGAAFHVEISYFEDARSWGPGELPDKTPGRFTETDITVNGERVFKYFPCLKQGECTNKDPSIVYEQDYVFMPKPGYYVSVQGVVSINDAEVNDANKKQTLITKSSKQFESILRSFQFTE